MGVLKLKCLEQRKFSPGCAKHSLVYGNTKVPDVEPPAVFQSQILGNLNAVSMLKLRLVIDQLINSMLVLVMQLVLTLTTNLQLADFILAWLVIRWDFNLMTFMNNKGSNANWLTLTLETHAVTLVGSC